MIRCTMCRSFSFGFVNFFPGHLLFDFSVIKHFLGFIGCLILDPSCWGLRLLFIYFRNFFFSKFSFKSSITFFADRLDADVYAVCHVQS